MASSATRSQNSSQDAVDRGAQPLTGGTAVERAGYFYEPTVLGDVHARHAAC